MNDNGLQLIDDFLSEDWVDAWAGDVVTQIEDYLGKQAAFEAFLDGRD